METTVHALLPALWGDLESSSSLSSSGDGDDLRIPFQVITIFVGCVECLVTGAIIVNLGEALCKKRKFTKCDCVGFAAAASCNLCVLSFFGFAAHAAGVGKIYAPIVGVGSLLSAAAIWWRSRGDRSPQEPQNMPEENTHLTA